MEKKTITLVGANLSTIIFVIFLVLKLAEIGPVANWSWWWVTSPLWISWLIVLSILFIVGISAAIFILLFK